MQDVFAYKRREKSHPYIIGVMNQKHSFITVKDGNTGETGESVYLIRLRGDSYFESKIKFQLKNTYMYLVLL